MDDSSSNNNGIRLRVYILLESRNAKGTTIDERGILEWHRSALTIDEYISIFNEHSLQNDFWLVRDFLSDSKFISAIKARATQMKNPSFRANILGQNKNMDVDYLANNHPFGMKVLPLIVSIFSN